MRIHRLFVLSITALIGIETLTVAANAAKMITYTRFVREGTVEGFGGVISNIVSYGWHYSGGLATPDNVERPNAAFNWDFEYDDTRRETYNAGVYGPMAPIGPDNGAPFADFTAAANWMDANVNGRWTIDYGTSTYTFDTSPYYKSVLNQQHFMELSAASSQQFLNIRNSGSTGTFRFDLSTNSPDPANSRYALDSNSDGYSGLITSDSGGDYFEVSIESPLSADATLTLDFGEADTFAPVPGSEASLNMQSAVVYGYTYAVPEPSVSLFVGVFGAGWVVLCFSRSRARRRP